MSCYYDTNPSQQDFYTATHIFIVNYLQIKWLIMEERGLQNDQTNTKGQFCGAVAIPSTQYVALSVPQERKRTFPLFSLNAAGIKCMSQILSGSECPQRVNSDSERGLLNESVDQNISILSFSYQS